MGHVITPPALSLPFWQAHAKKAHWRGTARACTGAEGLTVGRGIGKAMYMTGITCQSLTRIDFKSKFKYIFENVSFCS
jgi:hypothetical protein